LFPPAHIEITSFFNLVMVWNKGVSFGMFASAHDYMPYILSLSALVLCGFLVVWMKRAIRLTTLIPLAMIIAGAISNVWDRVRFGAVADFLDFHYQDIHYPAFNIADCCIVLGVIALAIDGLFLDPRSPKKEV
jgi:signal peptidase II